MIATLLMALGAGLAGGLLAHRGLGEKKPWLVLGLAPQLGACLLSLLALLTLQKAALVYALLLAILLLWMWPGPGWERPRGQLLAASLAVLALSLVATLAGLDDSGFRPLETARFLRGWQEWPGPGLDLLVAALSWPESDPLASAWGVRLALQAGGALIVCGLVAAESQPLVGLVAALWMGSQVPAGAGMWLYLTTRLLQRSLPLRAAPLLAVVPLWSPDVLPWWWLGGLLACLGRLRDLSAWVGVALGYLPGLAWAVAFPPSLTLTPLLGPLLALAAALVAGRSRLLAVLLAVAAVVGHGRPLWQTPSHWRTQHQQVDASDLQALRWLALQGLPGERVVSDRAGLDRALGELCALESAPRDAVWLAYQATGRADLLSAAGIDWLWLDVRQRPVKSPLLTPGPRFGSHQLFGVLSVGAGYQSDYAFPCRVQLPRETLRPARAYPLVLDVTNHDHEARRLGWLRVQVVGEPALDILAGRGRLASEMGDRLRHTLLTPARPGRYTLVVSQPHTVDGHPWVLARVSFEVLP